MDNIYQSYNELYDEIKKLELQVKGLKAQKDSYEEAIIDDMTNQGISAVKRDGYNYIINVEKKWPKIVDALRTVDWFINNDTKERLTVNVKTLNSFIKETHVVPDGVEVTDKIDLARRKA